MDYNEMSNNKVTLTGRIATSAEFSHEVMGEGFYELTMAVPRLSEQEDFIPLTVSERLIPTDGIRTGDTICVTGQFRSYNKLDGGRSRLMLTLFVREFLEVDEELNPNIIELTGYVCKAPIYRTTPFKREICDVLLAVNRGYNKSDYIPCIAWGRNARYAGGFEIGDKVSVTGRIQSRNYQKVTDSGTETRTAFEVSVSKLYKLAADDDFVEVV